MQLVLIVIAGVLIAVFSRDARGLHFDLADTLPIVQVDLRLAQGTRVAPVRIQGRNHADDAWRELGAGVFYRLERGSEVSHSPPLALHTRARFGRAVLGDWVEVEAVARAADRDAQIAALRPWLLWAVLLAGVAGLAFMVWRLTRPRTPAP